VRPQPPHNQLPPYRVPDSYDRIVRGYPAEGYDPAALGFQAQPGTNSCRYKFYDKNPKTDPSAVVIGSGYCVEWAAGQLSGTGYDPEPQDGTVVNQGYVRYILEHYWPATDEPAVPATAPAKTVNAQRSGSVSMAIHYFTDGIVMPPTYQGAGIYQVVAGIVADAIANGPAIDVLTVPGPNIDGPVVGVIGQLTGPYTIGANVTARAAGPVMVEVAGGSAFTDAAGTQPFTSGDTLPVGAQLWVRSIAPAEFTISARVVARDPVGTLLVGDQAVNVQSMMLAGGPVNLLGKSTFAGSIVVPPVEARLVSQVSADVFTTGGAVVDTFWIGGLGPAGTGELNATLYGPIPAPADGSGCAAAAWSPVAGLPVARQFAPIPVTGDQSLELDETVLAGIGCYSFGAVLTRSGDPPVLMLPGDPDETLRVVVAPAVPPWRIRSVASDPRIETGDLVHDTVVVSRLSPGLTLTLRSGLLGPVRTPASGRCIDVRWLTADAPVRASFAPRTVTANGAFTTPDVRLRKPGCYTFVEYATNHFLTGGEEPAPHGYGVRTELVRVSAASPAPSPAANPPPAEPETPAIPAGDTSSGGGLPDTGGPNLLWLAAGSGLVVLGGVVAGVGRWRRRPTR